MRTDSRPCQTEGSGTFTVGEEIQPGTWVAYDATDCCWERTATDGRNLVNDFATVAERIAVTVRPSDAFFTTDCGVWYYTNR